MVRQSGLGKNPEIGTVVLMPPVPMQSCVPKNSCDGEPPARLSAASGCGGGDAKKAWRWPELCFLTKAQAQLVLQGAFGVTLR